GGTVILQTDVTGIMREERQERDRLVTKQARMLRATLDHLAQSICIFDKRRRLVGWNQRMEDLLKRPLGSSFHGGDFDSLLDRLDRLFSYERLSKVDLRAWAHRGAGRAPLSFEVRRSDDTIFDVFMQELPDGGFVISFTDITDERRTSQALRELNETLERRVEDRTTELGAALEDARRANATKTRFVAAASHDLLQPMSAAKLYASVLEDRMMEDADRDLVRKTASALESAEGIITALLDISKLDLGLATFKLAEVELDQLFASLANEFVPHALGRGLHLTFVPTSLVVESDEAHLYRILQNLVSNAVRYTTGGRILVGARRRGGDVVIEVRDQGPGISGADQQVIFQEFQQLRRSTGEPQGLGLGLAIVDRACRMLGHTLSLDSALGRGSCFSVAAPRALGAAPRTPDQPAAAPQSGVLVGLVENDDALRNSITLTIEAMGSDVFASASGEEALALFEELGVAPDCFVLDYQLGEGMLGTELVPLLRRRWGDVPMTIISANRSAELEAACTDLGVELRHKPLARADIAAILARV
ncbi:MAG: ATP-binding protein, partial [Pseudomonadota bacterium]